MKKQIPIHAPKLVGTLSTIEALSEYADLPVEKRQADLVEMRLDCIMENEYDKCFRICKTLEETKTPVLMTLRQTQHWTRGDKPRLAAFKKAIKFVSYVDIEYDSAILKEVVSFCQKNGKKVIISYHNYDETPNFDFLQKMTEEAYTNGADIVKVATMVNELKDHAPLVNLLDKYREKKVCVLGMGAKGVSSRVYFPSIGSCYTYGYLDKPMAPGQLACSILCEILRKTCAPYNQAYILRTQVMEFV